MFGVSFTEIAVIALITLIFVGPQKLPGMLYTLGRWIRKLRQLTTEVRAQTGIDEILRQEGFEGGLGELRSMLRGDIQVGRGARRRHYDDDPYEENYELDQSREYPPEGADAAGAVPDDLVDEDDEDEQVAAPAEPVLRSHPAVDEPAAARPDAAGGDPPWKDPAEAAADAAPPAARDESKGTADEPGSEPRA